MAQDSRRSQTNSPAKANKTIARLLPEIPTPAILIEQQVMRANVATMQRKVDSAGLALRPHIKTHKMPELALLQMTNGAKGIAAATLHEAHVMANAGITDIQVANEIIQPSSIPRFFELAQKVNSCCAIDSKKGAAKLSEYFQARSMQAQVLVDINTGLNRTGLKPDEEAFQFYQEVNDLPGLIAKGIMTHAGHAYGAEDEAEVAAIAEQEAKQMLNLADRLQSAGFQVSEISIGATPTARFSTAFSGITELRVGNYIFNDRTQVHLGSAQVSDCALTVLATVISVPHAGRAVMNAGSKALTMDKGAHGKEQVSGFGKIQGKYGVISRLSEEHGVIDFDPGQANYEVGDTIRIIPNHACLVVNLYDKAYLVDGEALKHEIPVAASGH